MKSPFRPVPTPSDGGLVPVADGLWTIESKTCVHFRPPLQPRYPYPHRAVVVRLADGSLFVHSPVALTPALRAECETLGSVRYLVSPNNLHHLHLGEWKRAFPNAELYASPKLAPKRPDLAFTRTLCTNTPEPEWAGEIEQCVFGSDDGRDGLFDEITFFHRPTRTLMFADLVMDFDPECFTPLQRLASRWNSMYKSCPRGIRQASMLAHASMRRSLQRVRDWRPQRLIVSHSPWLCLEGQAEVDELLESAFEWLAPRPRWIEASRTAAQMLLATFVVMPLHALLCLHDRHITAATVRRIE